MPESSPTVGVRSWWKTEGVLLAAIPFFSYLLTYIYEAGYCKFFGIPWEFISPNWANVFIFAGGLLGLIVVMFFLIEPFFITIYPELPWPILRRLRRLSVPVLLSLIYLFLFGKDQSVFIVVVGVILSLALLEFGLPLLTQRDRKSYLEKLTAQDSVDDRVDGLGDLAARRLGPSVFGYLLLVYFLGCLSFYAGRAAAMNQENFLVLVDEPDIAIVRVYGDRLIGMKFNREKKLAINNFKILVSTGTALQLENIGPLKTSSK